MQQYPLITMALWLARVLVLAELATGNLVPILTPDPPEGYLVLQSGDDLTLTCKSQKPIKWGYPKSVKSDSTLNITDKERNENVDYPHVSVLEAKRLHYTDTGYYYCGDERIENVNEATAKTYVYVNDSTNLLIIDKEFILTSEYKQTVIPCRPTSPDVNVTIHSDSKSSEESSLASFQQRTTFTPQIGFTLVYTNKEDAGLYYCEAHRNNGSSTTSAQVDIRVLSHTDTVPAPEIQLNAGSMNHIEKYVTFSLNCSVRIRRDVTFAISWITPNNFAESENRLQESDSYKNLILENGRHINVGHRILTIHNASKEDNGVYMCRVKDHNDHSNNATYTVEVYDVGTAYINITDKDVNDSVISANTYETVQWVVHYLAHPSEVSAQWFNNEGTEMNNILDTKYTTTNNNTVSKLVLHNITLNDAGNYSLILTNWNIKKVVEKSLIVIGEPYNITINIADKDGDFNFISSKVDYIMHCHLLANPGATVKWRFRSCSLYTECDQEIELNGIRRSDIKPHQYSLTSEAKVDAGKSGYLTCIATNSIGTANTTIPFFRTDVPNGFELTHFSELVVDYEMILNCTASKFNYTDNIQWLKDGQSISGYEIIKTTTNFSYQSKLKVDKLTLENSGNYSCRAEKLTGGHDSKILNILVHNLERPRIISTNMSNTELSVQRNTEIQNLTCYGSGVPMPEIIWYKDSTVITPNSDRIQFSLNNTVLTLKHIQLEDAGRYNCELKNRGGTDSRYVDLTVTGGQPLGAGIIAIMVVLCVLLIVMVTALIVKTRKARKLKEALKEMGLQTFESGAVECINPDLGVEEQADLLPYDKKWEFPRNKLKLGKQLGSGAFGVVMKGEAIGIVPHENISVVAVKMVKANANDTHIKALASELKIMIHLGQHLNVVNLLGACTKNLMRRELLVIVEYCCFGNLQNYLLRHRRSFIDQVVGDAIDSTRGRDVIARALEEDRKAREAQEESNSSEGCSSPPFDSCSSPTSELSMRHGSVSSNPSVYQWNTQNTLSTDASAGGTQLTSDEQPLWRSNIRGDYKRTDLRPICTQDLLCWVFQVARGMEYLVSRKVLHGDLAARNILLAEDNVVKICDFGLARSMYQSENYKKKGDGPLPVKWMAIESIQDRVFSTQSDVWSFGIVMWEFFSLAKTPYPGMEADENMFNRIMDGYRMEKPKYATSHVFCIPKPELTLSSMQSLTLTLINISISSYNIMLDCWNGEPCRRPTFSDLTERLGLMLEESVRMHYINLNNPYLETNQEVNNTEDYLSMMAAPTYGKEMARQKTTTNDYMNIPQADQSESYLLMSSNKNDPEYPLTEEDGYLKMDTRSPTRSVLFSPHQTNEQFQFPGTNKPSNTDRNNANINEIKPMLDNELHYINVPADTKPTHNLHDIPSQPPPCVPDDDRFGDGLQSNVTSTYFDNPSYRYLNQDGVERKKVNSEASSSGFHSDSLVHSPEQSDVEPRTSPPPYQEATAMNNNLLV